MATTLAPSLRASLERMRHAGAINGLCMGWRRQVLVNLLPYEGHRAEKMIHDIADAREHFTAGGRALETFWFGYEGVHALVVFRDDCCLVILHSRTADVDFLAKAGHSFLEDSSVLVNAVLYPTGELGGEADPLRLGDDDETEPLSAITTNLIGRELI